MQTIQRQQTTKIKYSIPTLIGAQIRYTFIHIRRFHSHTITL